MMVLIEANCEVEHEGGQAEAARIRSWGMVVVAKPDLNPLSPWFPSKFGESWELISRSYTFVPSMCNAP